MFGFLKRKQREIFSPADGQLIDITEVPDTVFSQKMVGDGVALKPVGDTFCAPIDGVISKIFPTNHAFSIKSDKDMEVMVHIGLETVALEGKGFERLAGEGDKVSVGDPIIKVDLNYIAEHAKDTITPIIVSEESDVKSIEKKLRIVKCGDLIMEVN
ncbi:PTS sugar transporter subunit IIA [Sulfurovum sp. ST-21]|uniref:PTS system glucose-specific EIIA component n=1 Tax=Sulfurovum indicum TaxID=2779528 RepID=A0A7M1S426_9BACT|nr:PTS glucose transporter subunit IIA [Sulfurovum indicum]QOR62108.1 PTS glucose transporter subunit IIA [Sulfurovum indicum]